ncbi:MAG: succinyl-diaminopimelate desuccinylase [Gammaproteobacteria bacterium]|nr:succinyl-diaminopimelate desuccinylase [Gammaproteobacteria bacterium]MCY4217969.1 succinyl-diaminopimelate desuccinylase [Gammaproteobacteria bacterium]MCY4274847.1 succinyl-diaminopimelate desuccinylase [Gammaproteobacteria bacterium]
MNSPSVQLASDLIRIESVTPNDNGCQPLLEQRLKPLGFQCEYMVFEDVSNLWARHGTEEPLFVFAGHTDVVPTGPLDKWTHPPFSGHIQDGMLHGRGAADMKGGIACFVVACENFMRNYPEYKGSIALLITSDEEGLAKWGTRAVVDELTARNESINYCLVGEPTSEKSCGDTIKIGRRGSLNLSLTVKGQQGHIAYPQLANNPIHALAPILFDLVKAKWDLGNQNFPPTSLQISNVMSGTGAANVIPGDARVLFNFRYSPETNEQEIKQRIDEILSRHECECTLEYISSAKPYFTQEDTLIEITSKAISDIIGTPPDIETGGGTSDGRFLAQMCNHVVELGPLNATIHQIDECVSTKDLDTLTKIYTKMLERVFCP